MTFPPDRCMTSLLALDNASEGGMTADGRLFVRVGRAVRVVDFADLDELERLGWVALLPPVDAKTAAARVTEQGRYWLGRWVNKNRRNLPRAIQ
jgi:hypothetical protein